MLEPGAGAGAWGCIARVDLLSRLRVTSARTGSARRKRGVEATEPRALREPPLNRYKWIQAMSSTSFPALHLSTVSPPDFAVSEAKLNLNPHSLRYGTVRGSRLDCTRKASHTNANSGGTLHICSTAVWFCPPAGRGGAVQVHAIKSRQYRPQPPYAKHNTKVQHTITSFSFCLSYPSTCRQTR